MRKVSEIIRNRKKDPKGANEAARLEDYWSSIAKRDASQDIMMAKQKKKKGKTIVAKEYEWDAKIANKFSKIRKKRAITAKKKSKHVDKVL